MPSKEATARWDAENAVQVKMKLNKNTDADILEQLENVKSKQGYIKKLIRYDLERRNITMTRIQFEAGISRHSNDGVNFLMGEIDGFVLYAECIVPEGASDDYGYLDLKDDILRQAIEEGIDTRQLDFWYDGQESTLADDARANCEVERW